MHPLSSIRLLLHNIETIETIESIDTVETIESIETVETIESTIQIIYDLKLLTQP